MGLDISAYSELEFVRLIDIEDDGTDLDNAYNKGLVTIYINPDFPAQADNLIHNGAYSFEEKTGFRAGSYGYYSNWRNTLSRLAGYKIGKVDYYEGPVDIWDGTVTEGPFYELIMFSDCEGVIGPDTSAKLYQDFVSYHEKIFTYHNEDFYKKYLEWSISFEMASRGGCVSFH